MNTNAGREPNGHQKDAPPFIMRIRVKICQVLTFGLEPVSGITKNSTNMHLKILHVKFGQTLTFRVNENGLNERFIEKSTPILSERPF